VYRSRFLLAAYKCWKAILRFYTNTSELSRICINAVNEVGLANDWLQDEQDDPKEEIDYSDDSIPLLTRRTVWKDIHVPIEVVYRIDPFFIQAERHGLESKDSNLNEITQAILDKKNFPEQSSIGTPAASVLYHCLAKIRDSYSLASEIRAHAKTKFDTSKKIHEEKLLELWDLLMPDEALKDRYSDQWIKTLEARQMQYFLFKYGSTKDVFQEFFCYIFHSFNTYWTSQEIEPNAMDFEIIFEQFGKMIVEELLERKPMVLDESKEFFLQIKKDN
ncbi:16066_t:CDS:2, partial [Acaulospora colombiana]